MWLCSLCVFTFLYKPENSDLFNATGKSSAQKIKFSIKDFFSKCEQICGKLRIWSHLLKKSLMENSIYLCSEGGKYD